MNTYYQNNREKNEKYQRDLHREDADDAKRDSDFDNFFMELWNLIKKEQKIE